MVLKIEKPTISLRRFHESDAEEVSALIKKTLIEVNVKHYPKRVIDHLVAHITPKHLAVLSRTRHSVVLTEGNDIVATGSYKKRFFGRGIVQTLYVIPEYQGQGLGARTVGHLEQVAGAQKVRNMHLEASLWRSEFLYKAWI